LFHHVSPANQLELDALSSDSKGNKTARDGLRCDRIRRGIYLNSWPPQNTPTLLSCLSHSSQRRIFTIFSSEHFILKGFRFDQVSDATLEDLSPLLKRFLKRILNSRLLS
jgi:hypothetical protein